MKKIILTLFATIITLSAIAQTDIWYWKSGKAVKVSAVDSITFTAPAESDPPSGGTYPVLVSRGAYVVCGGNMSSNIDGSLTYYDYSTKTATQKAFQAVNGRSLGLTATDALVYGTKMYIVVDSKHSVEVVDAKTLQSIKRISMTELMGTEKGVHPRHITCYDGMIYVSTYGASKSAYGEGWSVTTEGNGYVAAIDTLTFSLKNTYDVGPFPEGLAAYNNRLYVCNSDYGACTRASISIIDLTQKKVVQTYTNENIVCPTVIAATGYGLYVLDMGNYADKASGMFYIDAYDGRCSRLFDASFVTFYNRFIYAVNAPFGASKHDYIRYDIQSKQLNSFTQDGVFSPCAIGADFNGHVFVASYKKNPDTGKANYSGNGYVAEYDETGVRVNEFDCGVGPNAIVFNTGIEYVNY